MDISLNTDHENWSELCVIVWEWLSITEKMSCVWEEISADNTHHMYLKQAVKARFGCDWELTSGASDVGAQYLQSGTSRLSQFS